MNFYRFILLGAFALYFSSGIHPVLAQTNSAASAKSARSMEQNELGILAVKAENFVEAEKFLDRVRNCSGIIILSSLFFDEVNKISYCSKENTLEFFKNFGVEIKCVDFNRRASVSDIIALGIHYPDYLHVAFAIKAGCDCIVTFNVKDFLPARKLISIFDPSEF